MSMDKFYNEREIEGSSNYLRNKVIQIINSIEIDVDNYLDIGVGSCDFTKKIANEINANCVYGLDINDKSIKLAISKGIKASKINLNVEKLPYSSNFFDLITIIDVIEHLTNSDNLLREINRIIKPGGYLIISSPNIGSWISIISLILGYLPPEYEISLEHRIGKPFGNSIKIPLAKKPIGHIKPYNLRSLKEHLMINGFDVISVKSTRLIGGKGILKVIAGLDIIFSNFKTYASGVIILARNVSDE